jgi:hypothetical protein
MAVAPAGPGGLVARLEESVEFGFGEVGEEVALGPFGRDGEHPLDRRGVFGIVEGEVGEQRVNGCQAVVACCGRIVPIGLEVVQEGGDERRVEIGDIEGAGRPPGPLGSEAEKQSERHLVGGDGVSRWQPVGRSTGR